ncbi:ArsR/SmtB family transcription factor [Roseovarius aquimarinus]
MTSRHRAVGDEKAAAPDRGELGINCGWAKKVRGVSAFIGSPIQDPLAYDYICGYLVIMNQTATTARALAALGHEARLNVYRLLVRAGEEGLIIGDIAEHTGIPLSTLAHHLRQLVSAGLVIQEKRGREVVNRVDYEVMNRALRFLTDECCQGVTLKEDAA